MKILHVLNGALGGASLSTLDLIEGLAARGHESFIYCNGRGSPEARDTLLQRARVPVEFGPMYLWSQRIRKPRLLRPLMEAYQQAETRGLYASSSRVMAFARRMGVQLIHSSTLMSPDGAIAAARLGLPHIWHVREMVGPGQLHRFRGDAKGGFGKRLLRSGQVIANSRSSHVALFGEHAVSGAVVIHNGFDFSRLGDDIAPPMSSGRLVFGLVANLSSTWKRHEVFIRAAAEVAAQRPDARFRVFGEVPDEHTVSPASAYARQLRALVHSLGLADRLSFCGYEADVGAIMRKVDVVVHPSENESFGRVFVEASAAGRALIAADGGAAAEIIRHGATGLLVPPGEVGRFAEAMLQLAQSPEQARLLGEGARAEVGEHYALDRCCARIEKVYEQVLRADTIKARQRSFAASLFHVMA